MPRKGITEEGISYYEIAMCQFRQNILPDSCQKPTTVWSYGSLTNLNGTLNYPAFTIEAQANTPVRVKWINQLVDSNGRYLSHLLPVDPTLHWANPAGPIDTRPSFTSTPGRYTGPVPMVVHLHGGHTPFDSDGYPEAWYLPNASNTPPGYSKKGTHYASPYGTPDDKGAAVFQYPNDQRATTLWYHDHTLGMTRLNVYAGPAGFYNIRGGDSDLPSGVLPGPSPQIGDKPGTKYYEIPIVLQDRSFNSDGSLFYPDSRAFFGDVSATGPFIPASGISPIWVPEFFGDTIVVNGKTWPSLTVEARRYRFRFLNGSQARTFILKLVRGSAQAAAARPVTPDLPIWLIGTEGGFLPKPVQLSQLVLANAERNDVIVDFTGREGTDFFLINEGPDGPYNGETPTLGTDPPIANPATTGQVMKFHVVACNGRDTSTPPDRLKLPAFAGLGTANKTRKVALFEKHDASDRPLEVRLGTPDTGMLKWMDPVTEDPALGATEIWEIYNNTVDAHPIHLHELFFQVLNRQNFTAAVNPYDGKMSNIALGSSEGPRPHEIGYKDTVLSFPGQVTRLKARFDRPNLYVWHCHIVEHEDNEMMRPYVITLNPSVDLGSARGYCVLAVNGAKFSMSSPDSMIYGDVGLGPRGNQNLSGGLITGTFFVDPSASGKSKKIVITGGTVDRDLAKAASDASHASIAASAMPVTKTLGKIDQPQTITGNGGLSVIRVDSISLSKGSLVLTGGPNDEFIINVSEEIKLNGKSSITLGGQLLPSRVLFNLQYSGKDVSLSGSSTIEGSILAPGRKVSLSGGSQITGAVIAGDDVSLSGGSIIRLVS